MSEVVNRRLNYSREMIKQINHINGTSDELNDVLELAFAGMLSYYGEEAINELYVAFLKTKIVISNSSIKDLIKTKYKLTSEVLQEALEHAPGTFYEVTGHEFIDKNHRRTYKFDRVLYIQNDGSVDKATLVRSVMHQVNHVLNSINNPVVSAQGKLAARMGVSLDRFATRETTHLKLEEAINRLQVDDMMSEIFDFGSYTIEDESIRKNVFEFINCPRNEIVDDELTKIIRPLYEDDFFNALLVDKRISGRLNAIREEFDFYTEPGDFTMLLDACSMISTGKDEKEKSAGQEIARQLVKKYIESGYGDN